MFITMKTYFTLEKLLNTYNLFYIYAIVGIFGTVYLYIRLPETENKSLEEIEQHFQGGKKATRRNDP